MKKLFTLGLIFGALSGAFFMPHVSKAADSCAEAPQPDGTLWRTCVDDAGRQYCESCSNGVCSRVSCSS